MDFRFTQDQQDLIDAAKTVFDGENTLERMRALVAGDNIQDIWPQFAKLGLLGIMAKEEFGGLEQPLIVMTAIAEAAGYAGIAEPFVEIAGISIPLSENPQQLISGEIKSVIKSPLRPYANADAANGEPIHSIDPLRHLVKLQDYQKHPKAEYHGAVLSAAQLIGLSQRMVDMSVDYAKSRNQFGKPIGSFQAVKHHLASVYTQIEFTRPIIYLAALKGGSAIHTAKICAIDTSILASETAIQVHGGMGYTFEVDLHLFMKRAWALCGEWGDRNYHMKKLEEHVLYGDEPIGAGTTF